MVKSFFGSRGVVADHVTGRRGTPAQQRLYALLNNTVVRDAVITAAAHRYGYRPTRSSSASTSANSQHPQPEATKIQFATGAQLRTSASDPSAWWA